MQSNMSHSFSNAPSISAPRSSFDRSFTHKTTFNAGYLIPFYLDDVLPGDTFNLNTTAFARLATPLFPFMDNLYLDTHFFFIPTRLVWDNSKKFYGEQDNPTDSIDFAKPVFTSFIAPANSLHDYFGLPVGKAQTPVSLYHRAYNLVWNEWFRDQNIQNSVTVDKGDGPDNSGNYVLKRRGKRHDYFTSCLPWPQKGDAVNLPLGTQAPISGIGVAPANSYSSINPQVYDNAFGGLTNYANATGTNLTSSGFIRGPSGGGIPDIYADLTQATAATISDLREAFQIQKLLERDARSGTRYSELVRNHFGVDFYDVSYRPEFLGGGTTPINSTPVANTFSDVGALGAFSTASFSGHGFSKSFVEHGIVIGLISARADLTYQQGMPRRFLKSTRYDDYWPSLAHLGEQEVTNAEIYFQGNATDDDVFGYQERYAEYRYNPSMITGVMRSNHVTSLDPWHLSQDFSSVPVLGNTFIEEFPPIDRISGIVNEPHFILDTYTSLKCARPMPVHGVPGFIDHF